MSMKERVRLEVFAQVKRGEISVGTAGQLAGVSARQAKRIWKRYKREGDGGLVHRLRGRPGNAGQAKLREIVLALCREQYADFGSVLAAEYLVQAGYSVPAQTLWRWRREAGELRPSRRGARHRIRRAARRRGRAGSDGRFGT